MTQIKNTEINCQPAITIVDLLTSNNHAYQPRQSPHAPAVVDFSNTVGRVEGLALLEGSRFKERGIQHGLAIQWVVVPRSAPVRHKLVGSPWAMMSVDG